MKLIVLIIWLHYIEKAYKEAAKSSYLHNKIGYLVRWPHDIEINAMLFFEIKRRLYSRCDLRNIRILICGHYIKWWALHDMTVLKLLDISTFWFISICFFSVSNIYYRKDVGSCKATVKHVAYPHLLVPYWYIPQLRNLLTLDSCIVPP